MNPVIRIIFITLSAISVMSATLLLLRHIGLSQNHRPLEPDFLKRAPLAFFKGGRSSLYPSNSALAFKSALDEGGLNMVHVQRTKDGHFILFEPKLLEQQTDGKGLIFSHTLEQLKKLNASYKNKSQRAASLMSLSEYIKRFGNKPFIINMIEQDPAKMHGLKELLIKHQLVEQIILHSPYTETLSYLRKELPRATFSINKHSLVKMLFFSSLYIEPLTPIKGDIVISPSHFFTKFLFSKNVLQELKRRNLKIILDKDLSTSPPEGLADILSGSLER